ncbi:MAG: hypothetical protein HOV79_06295 [Hamadaea sp.]|nr:hypothetical protein [Hamadaea sp.]
MSTSVSHLEGLIDAHGIEISGHLDRQVQIPVLAGFQRQGDVLVVPVPTATATVPVPPAGVPVVPGADAGNSHTIVADGDVWCDLKTGSAHDLVVSTLVVAEGACAYLAHPEHGYSGIAPGRYEVRRQREIDATRSGAIVSLVAD